jgi:hypothetical protein
MIGMKTIRRVERLQQQARDMGLEFADCNHHFDHDYIALIPLDTCLPVYRRGAEIYVGTLDEIEQWLRGVVWARDYDRMLRISDDKKRAEGEKREGARIAAMLLKQEQDKAWKILQEKIT